MTGQIGKDLPESCLDSAAATPRSPRPRALVTASHDAAHRAPAQYRVFNRAARTRYGWAEVLSMTQSTMETAAAKLLHAEDMNWAPHPKFKGVEIAYLLSKKEDGIDMTCILARWHVGAEIPKHIHEDSDDIIYVIQGKAKIWIENVGDLPLRAGSFVRVPKGVLHQPHDVEEELIAHDTWFPATV